MRAFCLIGLMWPTLIFGQNALDVSVVVLRKSGDVPRGKKCMITGRFIDARTGLAAERVHAAVVGIRLNANSLPVVGDLDVSEWSVGGEGNYAVEVRDPLPVFLTVRGGGFQPVAAVVDRCGAVLDFWLVPEVRPKPATEK